MNERSLPECENISLASAYGKKVLKQVFGMDNDSTASTFSDLRIDLQNYCPRNPKQVPR